jgi:tyrosyl-DNA phosphodiesterase-1
LNEFYWSTRGESAEEWLDEPKTRREKLPYPPVRVVFPTKKIVQASALGEPVSFNLFTSVVYPMALITLSFDNP